MTIFRFDRILSIYFFYPLKKYLNKYTVKENKIPILMYHSISNDLKSKVHPYFETYTSPSVFEKHMNFLKSNGYTVISMDDVKYYLNSNNSSKKKYVVITFDDGFYDFYKNARPTLKRMKFTASIFLPTRYIGDKPRYFKGKRCLTWTEVLMLKDEGFSFGSHTESHPKLYDCSIKQVCDELKKSKDIIEKIINNSVNNFSYPYAFPQEDKKYKKNIRKMIRDAGYKKGVTTVISVASKTDDILLLPRLPINEHDDLRLFNAKLNSGYDWVSIPQLIIRSLKRKIKKSGKKN